jgi:hypothetical protein
VNFGPNPRALLRYASSVGTEAWGFFVRRIVKKPHAPLTALPCAVDVFFGLIDRFEF